MTVDHIRYDILAREALRGVVRTVLEDAAKNGLPGEHHFFVTFDTRAEGVAVSQRLRAQHPAEMTIVLQHQFRALEVRDDTFSVILSFQNRAERLTIPFVAVATFADPSVNFGLQFEAVASEATEAPPPAQISGPQPADPERPAAEIVALDKFRKR